MINLAEAEVERAAAAMGMELAAAQRVVRRPLRTTTHIRDLAEYVVGVDHGRAGWPAETLLWASPRPLLRAALDGWRP